MNPSSDMMNPAINLFLCTCHYQVCFWTEPELYFLIYATELKKAFFLRRGIPSTQSAGSRLLASILHFWLQHPWTHHESPQWHLQSFSLKSQPVWNTLVANQVLRSSETKTASKRVWKFAEFTACFWVQKLQTVPYEGFYSSLLRLEKAHL